MTSKKNLQIGIIGSNSSVCSKELYTFAFNLGKALADEGYILLNGGMQGVMEAVSKGAQQSDNKNSRVIGILPFDHRETCNDYLDIVIPTGVGFARNAILVLSSDILIALGGGAGTLNEISYAWQFNKKVFCLTQTEGWSAKIADTNIDHRKSDLLIGFKDISEVIQNIRNHE